MMKILERHQVSPPPNSVEETKYPLTHFDIPCIVAPDTETILFYDFPRQQTSFDFTQNIVPKLKQSLSLALQRFPCLVGSLVLASTNVPYILYQEGDSIPLVIVQSNADFDQLVKDDPKDSKDFWSLVPDHQRSIVPQEAAVETVRPLLAIQVTIFSNSGISICFKLCHVVGDGRTKTNFIKSWASIFKTTQDGHIMSNRASQDVPLNDQDSTARQVIISRDLLDNNLRSIMWDQLRQIGSTWDDFASRANNVSSIVLQVDKLHATFKLGTSDINQLKEWLMKRFQKFNEAPPLPYASTFVVTCAFIWVCLIKADIHHSSVNHHVSNEDNSFQLFACVADCTRRTEFNIPESYCGNCVMPCMVWVKKNELLGENGLFIAAKAIMQGIKNLDTAYVEAMKELIPKFSKVASITESMTLMSVAGSPKFLTYETDFGWGKPRKSEMFHIDKQCGAISLTDNRDDKGGVEVGVSLKKVKMNAFSSIFHLGLKNLEHSLLAP